MSPRLLLAAAVVALVACDADSIITPPPTSGGPLIAATYYMHQADDSTLAATISTRIAGVTQETTVLDSAQLTVNADSSYQERYWVRILLNGALDRRETIVDIGKISIEGFGYRLTSDVREREFTMVVVSIGNLTTFEQMVFYELDPPVTTGKYKGTHP